MIDNGGTLSNEEEIAETVNIYFCSIAKNLSMTENLSVKEPSVELFTDPVILALKNSKDHQSITSINSKITRMDNPKFSFGFVPLDETLDAINKLNPKKFSQAAEIPVKIIKENNNVESFNVLHNFNNASSSFSIPTTLKYCDVRPAFKKMIKLIMKIIESLVSSQIYVKCTKGLMYDQMYPFFDQIISKLECGFCKRFSAFNSYDEKRRICLDTGDHGSALLTKLSKVFDCIKYID